MANAYRQFKLDSSGPVPDVAQCQLTDANPFSGVQMRPYSQPVFAHPIVHVVACLRFPTYGKAVRR